MNNIKKLKVREKDIKHSRIIYRVLFYFNGEKLVSHIFNIKVLTKPYNVELYPKHHTKFFKAYIAYTKKGFTTKFIRELSLTDLGIEGALNSNRCFFKLKHAENYQKQVLSNKEIENQLILWHNYEK